MTALRRLTIALAALLILITLPLYALKVERKTDYTDFEVYYRAAQRVKLGQWDQVYNLRDGASPFRYAPPLLPFFRPFAELSLPQARLTWYFLQFFWFGLAFYLIGRTLLLTRIGKGRLKKQPSYALWITAASFLFILRFMLDSFTIGQSSSLLFLGFAASLYAWVARRPGAAGAALMIPSIFKIGPGILYALFTSTRKRAERIHSIGVPLLVFAGATLFLRVWAGTAARFVTLWQDWVQIVANDSVYYDASHYGSQSIKSAILRAVNSGWLSAEQGHLFYLMTVMAGCLAFFGFWATRRTKTPLGRGLFFALGIFPYLWFMPETFKYSLTTLAIPVALLLASPRKTRLTWFALGLGALTLSVAGLDLIGKTLFFGLQRSSIPLLSTFWLGAAVLQQARSHSRSLLTDRTPPLAPWNSVPKAGPGCELSLIFPLPLQSFSQMPASHLRGLVHQTQDFFKARGASFEILIAPFGDRVSEFHPLWPEVIALQAELSTVEFPIRILPPPVQPDRGAALREAFVASHGHRILCTHPEQPCDLQFFSEALRLLEDGADLVRANRRLPESRFQTPVKYLSVVYGRHRLGLLFNQLVRHLLPITTTDTHSGTWAMKRDTAAIIFALQKSSGFLFDLEISLTATAFSLKQKDLPVQLFLAQEKTVQRISGETLSILKGLPLLVLRHRRGCYQPQARPNGITADDWGLSPGVNEGILELARLGVVKRVSVMAYGRFLQDGLRDLLAIPEVELGLHFDLTHGKSAPGKVLLQWIRPGRDRAGLATGIQKEFSTQLAILKNSSIEPKYLDGHHHIHLVPGLLDALAPQLKEAGIRQVRLPFDRALFFSKLSLVALAWSARRTFRRHGFESLKCFYPQAPHFQDQGLFRARLGANPAAEVIVHPARVDDLAELQIPDSYTSGRVTEYKALRMLALTPGTTHD